jgi:wyosine [tRNA(Phe)-imidazoG37] synthetase (radical SAM superfamily)
MQSPAPLSETLHPRNFRNNLFVYPVLSRRSGGISVGINLNPDKACNFDCIYCQVNRRVAAPEHFVGIPRLLAELSALLDGLAPGGELWDEPEFSTLPPGRRRVADIAFSGDGEPTTFRNFGEVIEACVGIKERAHPTIAAGANVVVITNATGFDRPDVQRAFEFLDRHRGEIWAKLDAGTAAYFKLIDATDFPFEKVLANIAACARLRPVVIQSCFMNVRGIGPSADEVGAFVQRLRELTAAGGRIARVQIYTVARAPALSIVSSLSDAEVDALARRLNAETGLLVEAFYGAVPPGQGHDAS